MKKVLGILASLILVMIIFQDCQKSEFSVITGVVRDSLTNQPVQGAYIITGDGHYKMTDLNGTFKIDGTKASKVSFYTYCRGYYSKMKSYFVSGDRVTKVDFILSPISQSLIETGAVTNITATSAIITGSVKLKSGASVYQCGHCWSNSIASPTLDESAGHSSDGTGSGEFSFTTNITGLSVNNVYFVRAYALTDAGIIYGYPVAFTTYDDGMSTGLIYYYPFNGNNLDYSGNAYGLSAEMYSNPPIYGPYYTTDRFGNMNCASTYTSTSGKYYGANTPALNDFAVSLWFRKNNTWEYTEQHLFQIGDSYGNFYNDNRFYITQDAGSQCFNAGIRIGGTYGTDYRISDNAYPSLNTWHHVVAQRSGSSFYFYIDGVLIKSISCSSAVLPHSVWFNIGGAWIAGGGYQQFIGDLDELRLYNRALSNDEIQYLYTH